MHPIEWILSLTHSDWVTIVAAIIGPFVWLWMRRMLKHTVEIAVVVKDAPLTKAAVTINTTEIGILRTDVNRHEIVVTYHNKRLNVLETTDSTRLGKDTVHILAEAVKETDEREGHKAG